MSCVDKQSDCESRKKVSEAAALCLLEAGSNSRTMPGDPRLSTARVKETASSEPTRPFRSSAPCKPSKSDCEVHVMLASVCRSVSCL